MRLTNRKLGTPGYRCLDYENSDGSKYEPRCDIFSLGVVIAEIMTGYLSMRVASKSNRSNGGPKGKSLYGFFMRQPDYEEDEETPACMEKHLDPRAGEMDKSRTSRVVDLSRKCMQWNPARRPFLADIINILQRTVLNDEQDSPTSEGPIKQDNEKGTLCDICSQKWEKCHECTNALSKKHKVCAQCIESLASKLGDNPYIVCPIRNCKQPFDGETLKEVLGEKGYEEYIGSLTYFEGWRDAVVEMARRHAPGMGGDVSNEEIFRVMQRMEARMDAMSVSAQMANQEIRAMLLASLRMLGGINNKLERSQAILSLLATGETIPCPRLLWLLPCERDCSKITEFLRAPFKCKWKIFFVCEKSHRIANPHTPMEMWLCRQWIRNLAPLVKLSLIALRIAGCMSGFPPLPGFKDLNLVIPEYEEMLVNVVKDENLQDIATEMKDVGVFEEMERFVDKQGTEGLSAERVACVRRLTGQSYRRFSEQARQRENLSCWEPYMETETVKNRLVWIAKKNPGKPRFGKLRRTLKNISGRSTS
mmetsp:Transcript_1063/g.2647  ORF Transcript_1063/g.2647 Transcript_1063/m.2647 type:complete len:534 (+) Transcript_1063:1-1602(+)